MTLHLTIAIVAVFASVALGTGLVASRVLALRAPERKRFKEMFQPEPVIVTSSLVADRPDPKAAHLDRWIPRWPARLGSVRPRLEALGYRSSSAVAVFCALQFGLG